MRYYKLKGREYVENGRAKLRVTTMDRKPSPVTAGRTLRVCVVNDVERTSETNPIKRGVLICLSFPNEKVNALAYTWSKGEETTVKLEAKLHRIE